MQGDYNRQSKASGSSKNTSLEANPSGISITAAKKQYFIGVDSDGTAFDSMEIKHKRVFQPIALEIWGLHSCKSDFYEIAEAINLYSIHRGVNRFQGLAMAFQRLSHRSEVARIALEGHSDLCDFVLAGVPLSAESLVSYNSSLNSHFLEQVLEWSQRSDEEYNRIMELEGNSPYPTARKTLQRAFPSAEIVVISSSSQETLMKDWSGAGLLELTDAVAGQETGTKTEQLRSALEIRDELSHAIMIGDASGDLEAAETNGILFYPILPGSEEASWQLLETEALARFFEGTYAGEYQDALLTKFKSTLTHDDPWPKAAEAATQTSLVE